MVRMDFFKFSSLGSWPTNFNIHVTYLYTQHRGTGSPLTLATAISLIIFVTFFFVFFLYFLVFLSPSILWQCTPHSRVIVFWLLLFRRQKPSGTAVSLHAELGRTDIYRGVAVYTRRILINRSEDVGSYTAHAVQMVRRSFLFLFV